MNFLIHIILLIGFPALCAAQFQDLPGCAKPCASSLPAQCHLDVSCICSDSAWISGISCCVKNQCSPSDQAKTLNVAAQLCDTVNVKLPSAASCPASASATAASATAAPSSAIAGANTVASETSNISSVSGATKGAVSGAQATSSSPSSGDLTTTTTSATGSSTPLSSSATQATGAAQVLGSNIGAVGAAVAALALL